MTVDIISERFEASQNTVSARIEEILTLDRGVLPP